MRLLGMARLELGKRGPASGGRAGVSRRVRGRGAGPSGGNGVPARLGDFLAGGEGEAQPGPLQEAPESRGLTASAHLERRPPPAQLSLHFWARVVEV